MPASLFNLGRYVNKPKTPPAGDVPPIDTTVTTTTASTTSQSQYSASSMDGDIAPSPTLPPPPHANDQPATSVNGQPPAPTAPTPEDKKESVTAEPPAPMDDKLQKRAGMDILSRLTQRSNKALVVSVARAKQQQIQFVDTEYILWGLIQDR